MSAVHNFLDSLATPRYEKTSEEAIDLTYGPKSSVEELLDMRDSVGGMIGGKYCLGKILGRGTYSTVREATDMFTGIKVAVKVIKPEKNKIREAEREIAVLRKVQHENVIRLHDVYYKDRSGKECSLRGKPTSYLRNSLAIYIVLQVATGGELFEYIVAKEKLNEEEAKYFFKQILKGLDYAHMFQIAHRDLKLENILLDSNMTVKIIDFGYSTFIFPGSKATRQCGSVAYASPEILCGVPYDPFAADLWSLGIMLFAMITGNIPWKIQDNEIENLDDVLAGKFDIPQDVKVSKDCEDLLRRMIVGDPNTRATVHEIKNHPWLVGEHMENLLHRSL